MTIKMTIYVDWNLTQATKFKLEELYAQYGEMEEGSDDSLAIVESIKSLPGFPHGAPVDSDFYLNVTDKQFH